MCSGENLPHLLLLNGGVAVRVACKSGQTVDRYYGDQADGEPPSREPPPRELSKGHGRGGQEEDDPHIRVALRACFGHTQRDPPDTHDGEEEKRDHGPSEGDRRGAAGEPPVANQPVAEPQGEDGTQSSPPGGSLDGVGQTGPHVLRDQQDHRRGGWGRGELSGDGDRDPRQPDEVHGSGHQCGAQQGPPAAPQEGDPCSEQQHADADAGAHERADGDCPVAGVPGPVVGTLEVEPVKTRKTECEGQQPAQLERPLDVLRTATEDHEGGGQRGRHPGVDSEPPHPPPEQVGDRQVGHDVEGHVWQVAVQTNELVEQQGDQDRNGRPVLAVRNHQAVHANATADRRFSAG